MKVLDSLEKRFGHLAIPNVVLILIVAQLLMYAAILVGRVEFVSLVLIPKAVLNGEWWRLFSFVIAPPTVAQSLIQGLFLAFYWYIFWMMSSALEQAWGVFRFNVFLFVGFLLSILGAFVGQLISPSALIFLSPYFLYLSVFFAFATLNPNIQFLIFFVVPVKVKWIAWFVAAMTAVSVIGAGSIGMAVAILAPLLNYVLFFRDAMTQSVISKKRRKQFDKERRATAIEALHSCSSCGATDRSNPEREFRYKMIDGDAVCVCDACRG
ncbi:MAG TPA: hypothetical protein DCX06_04320 [Opitutae bacterium]|nr:hypothetical protein [Opitutae bacterium]